MSNSDVCTNLVDGGFCNKQAIVGYQHCREHLHFDEGFSTGVTTAVRKIVAEQLGLAVENSFSNTDAFGDQIDIDSLDAVELVMAIEEEFNIKIPDEMHGILTCVDEIAKYLIGRHSQNVKEYLCGAVTSGESSPVAELIRANPLNVLRQIKVILRSEDLRVLCHDTGFKQNALEDIFALSLRGNYIEQVTYVWDTRAAKAFEKEGATHHELFLLTRKAIFHFCFSGRTVNAVRVGLEDTYLNHSEDYDENGKVSAVHIRWNIKSHVGEIEKDFTFNESEGIQGARRFMGQYLKFLENMRDTSCPFLQKG